MDDQEGKADLATICRHEAAHAVMRRLVGLPATRIRAKEGEGICEGAWTPISPEADLRVTLAGYAYNCMCGFPVPDFETSRLADLVHARWLLGFAPELREIGRDEVTITEDAATALQRHFSAAGMALAPYGALIEELGSRLQETGDLSAESVEAFVCRAKTVNSACII